MLLVVDQLEALQLRFSQETVSFIERYRRMNADYDSTRPAFDQLFSDYSAKRIKARSAALDLHFQLASLATADECAQSGKLKQNCTRRSTRRGRRRRTRNESPSEGARPTPHPLRHVAVLRRSAASALLVYDRPAKEVKKAVKRAIADADRRDSILSYLSAWNRIQELQDGNVSMYREDFSTSCGTRMRNSRDGGDHG